MVFKNIPSNYEPLFDQEDHSHVSQNKSIWTRRNLFYIIFFQALLNVGFVVHWISTQESCSRAQSSPYLYSPAQDAIEETIVKFTGGFGKEKTIYVEEPSPEVDKAWEDLYQMGISKVPRSQAALMVNATWPISEDRQEYILTIDVFHQLHCLNMLRKSFYPDYYPPMNLTSPDGPDSLHMGHCIDSIRQSLMCSSDITPIVWQWDAAVESVRIHMDVPHTCRDFGKLKDWGNSHRLLVDMNYTAYIEDDLEVAGIPFF